mmetsp:Transcript_9727/g.21942  ORF Transcript_9727/g.21942 Transcript_9727/m.21942 type:complete len:223 (+) Transcript_9727:75-743(+)
MLAAFMATLHISRTPALAIWRVTVLLRSKAALLGALQMHAIITPPVTKLVTMGLFLQELKTAAIWQMNVQASPTKQLQPQVVQRCHHQKSPPPLPPHQLLPLLPLLHLLHLQEVQLLRLQQVKLPRPQQVKLLRLQQVQLLSRLRHRQFRGHQVARQKNQQVRQQRRARQGRVLLRLPSLQLLPLQPQLLSRLRYLQFRGRPRQQNRQVRQQRGARQRRILP